MKFTPLHVKVDFIHNTNLFTPNIISLKIFLFINFLHIPGYSHLSLLVSFLRSD